MLLQMLLRMLLRMMMLMPLMMMMMLARAAFGGHLAQTDERRRNYSDDEAALKNPTNLIRSDSV